MPSGLLQGLTKLKTVTIGNSVNIIKQGAFSNNPNISNITIPESVTTIEAGAFSGWNSTQTISVLGYSSQEEATGYASGWNGNATVNWKQ